MKSYQIKITKNKKVANDLKYSRNVNFAVWDVVNLEQGIQETSKSAIKKVVK